MIEIPKLNQIFQPERSKFGNTKNIGSEGSTNQNVDSVCLEIFSVSPLSNQIQIIASKDKIGREAINAPNAGDFFVASEIRATMNPDKNTLMRK